MNDDNETAPMITEDELHAFADGRLDAEARAAFERRLAGDTAARETLAAWRAQRDALRALHADMLRDPVPASFAATAERAAAAYNRTSQWWRWGGIAASVLLAFALGWAGNGWRQGTQSATLASNAPVRSFAHQASLAHLVYLPEVRHPVEVPAAQQEHLVQWLSKRLGRPLKVPNLSAQGYDLVGGRLLPGDDGARAQFMFQNAAGERVTLYLGAVKSDSGPNAKETAFRFLDDPAAPGFYWVDQGFGYALSGKLSRSALQALATVVYQQL